MTVAIFVAAIFLIAFLWAMRSRWFWRVGCELWMDEWEETDAVMRQVRARVHAYWEDQHRHFFFEVEDGPGALMSCWATLGEIENILVAFDEVGMMIAYEEILDRHPAVFDFEADGDIDFEAD